MEVVEPFGNRIRFNEDLKKMEADKQMDQKTVRNLEDKLEEAIADVIITMGLKRLPLLPARHTMHMMAKAATAVYEAAVDSSRSPEN